MEKRTKKTEAKVVEKKVVLNRMVDKKMSVHLAFLVIVLVALGFGYFRYWNIAVVNGKGISRIAYIKTLEKQGGKQVIDGMIQEAMIRDEAKKKGVQIQQSAIDEEIKKIETQISAMGKTFDEALKSEGLTKAELEDQIRMQKMVEVMAGANVEITQAQIDKYIVDNKAQFPKEMTKEEIQSSAKSELTSQAANAAISKWLKDLNTNAKITYK